MPRSGMCGQHCATEALPRDRAPLMRFKTLEPNAKRRRLASALTIDDLRAIAKRLAPTAAFDYADGSTEPRRLT